MSTTISAIVFISSFLALGYLVFVQMPKDLTSLFCYKLWRIRDELMDSILNGTIPPKEIVLYRLREIEMVIAFSDQLSVLKVCMMPHYKNEEQPKRDAELNRQFFELSEAQRQLLGDCQSKLYRACLVHLVCGAPSGWLTLPLMLVAGFFHATQTLGRQWVEDFVLKREAFQMPDKQAPFSQSLAKFAR